MAPERWATLTLEKQFEEDKIATLIMPLSPHFYISLGKFSANCRHHKPLLEPTRGIAALCIPSVLCWV